MNMDGCPEGRFTDEIMLYRPTAQCNESVAAWLVVSLLCATLRTLLFAPHLVSITRKLARRKQDQALTVLAKLRVGAELAAGSTQLLFVVLSSANVASSRNGASPLLFSVYLSFIAFGQILDMQVMVKLGRRMLPFTGTGPTVSSDTSQSGTDLSQWDFGLKLLGGSSLVSLFLSQVLFVVLGMVFPNQVWVLQAGLALMLGYILCMSLFMCWQLNRCVRAIKALSLNAKDAKIQRAIRRFRAMQGMILVFTGVATTCMVLLIEGTLPFHWYVLVVIFMWGELVFESAMVWTTFPSSQRAKPVTDLVATAEEGKPRMLGVGTTTMQPSATS